jgi:hypothetical protein
VVWAVSAEQHAGVAHPVDDVFGRERCGFVVVGEFDAEEQT